MPLFPLCTIDESHKQPSENEMIRGINGTLALPF
jgi:hypothetical protein